MIPNRENSDCSGKLLPGGWEQAYDNNSRRFYFVDHNSRTTTWLNPLDKLTKPQNENECLGDQLPYGWEKINDSIVGTYYTNHIARKNQWTNPVSDWREKKLLNQHHYSNSQHLLSQLELSQTNSLNTTDKPDTSFHTSDDNTDNKQNISPTSNHLETVELNEGSSSKNNSIGNSKYDAGLLDIMDNCFGRRSSQSVEV